MTPTSLSRAAWRTWIRRPISSQRGRWGYRMGDGRSTTACCATASTTLSPASIPGWHTEDLVEKYRSRARPRTAGPCARSSASPRASGRAFQVADRRRSSSRARRGRRHSIRTKPNRPDTTLEASGALKPAFRPDGRSPPATRRPQRRGVPRWCSRTGPGEARPPAGRAARRLWHSRGRARHVRTWAVPAVKQALQRAGWESVRIERAEINEAFAAIAIVVARELGLLRRYRQCRGRRRRARPPDRRDGRGADHHADPLDAPRWP